mmetsp:Transcript_12624/g.26589  ORF Transcript_12624/g.26589 Transcript_12624/m.26589 type:complete len:214 (-) Transcript_12624:1279-1920(-)
MFPIGEDRTLVLDDRGEWPHAHNSRGHDAQATLAAKGQSGKLDACGAAAEGWIVSRRTTSGLTMVLPKHSDGSRGTDLQNHVLDVAVARALHAAGTRRNPTTKSRKLHGVGLHPHRNAFLTEGILQRRACDANLYKRHAILDVDPHHATKPAHVQCDERSGIHLLRGAIRCGGHVRATADGDNRIRHLALRGLKHSQDLLLSVRAHHDVGHAM